jgi:hypothetical protein
MEETGKLWSSIAVQIVTIPTFRSCPYPLSFHPSLLLYALPTPILLVLAPSPQPFTPHPSDTELTAKITKLHKEGKKAAKGKKDNGSNLF